MSKFFSRIFPDKTQLYKGVVSEFEESSGYVTSPNFPGGYALNGETFTYMIQNLDPYGHVRVTFDDWDIAPESKVRVSMTQGFSQYVCLAPLTGAYELLV